MCQNNIASAGWNVHWKNEEVEKLSQSCHFDNFVTRQQLLTTLFNQWQHPCQKVTKGLSKTCQEVIKVSQERFILKILFFFSSLCPYYIQRYIKFRYSKNMLLQAYNLLDVLIFYRWLKFNDFIKWSVEWHLSGNTAGKTQFVKWGWINRLYLTSQHAQLGPSWV